MKRKDFLKSTFTGGCACALLALGGNPILSAQDTGEKKPEKDENQEFITSWIEEFMGIMDTNLDEKTRAKIMEESGRKCAQKTYHPVTSKFKGNLEGLLEQMRKGFAENVVYDQTKGTVHVVGKKQAACFCPLVKGRSTLKSGTYCCCSIGWVKEVFETVTGKKVEVIAERTILRGSDHCDFKITIA